MKRHGGLYEKICTMENLELAFYLAQRGKLWQRKVRNIAKHKTEALEKIQKMLIDRKYKTSRYHLKEVYEPKRRVIYVLPFYPDRIVQHAVMNIVAPIWDNMFIKDSYACRQGKGQHKGSVRCMQFVKRNRYCLQCDISKFYPSMNHKKLIEIIARKIKCKDTLALFAEIIESIPGETNVPIGNYTSQWFGNLYLNELDQVMKHKYKVRDYIRYCDDFLLFFKTKEEAKRFIPIITDFVENTLLMRLSKCSLFPVSQGVDFLGYRHFPDGKILLRKSTAKRVMRRIRALPWKLKHGYITKDKAISVIASTDGWLQRANTYNLKKAIKMREIKKYAALF